MRLPAQVILVALLTTAGPRPLASQADSAGVAFWASGSSLVAFGTVRVIRDTIVWIDSIPVNDVVYRLTVGRQWIGTRVDSIDFRLPQVEGFAGGGPTQSAIDRRSPKQYLVYARLLGTGAWTILNIVPTPAAEADMGWLDKGRRAPQINSPNLKTLFLNDRSAIGEWHGCIEGSDHVSTCGAIVVDSALHGGGDYTFLRIHYTIPLRALSPDFPPADSVGPGTARPNDADNTWVVQFPLDTAFAWASDNGSIVASLKASKDSLTGTWERTCYAGCEEHGTIRFSRAHPSDGPHR